MSASGGHVPLHKYWRIILVYFRSVKPALTVNAMGDPEMRENSYNVGLTLQNGAHQARPKRSFTFLNNIKETTQNQFALLVTI